MGAAALMALLALARPAQAQQQEATAEGEAAVEGQVTDQESGKPLPGVNVVDGAVASPGVDMEAGTQVIPPGHPRMIFYIPEQEIELNPNLEQNPPLG